MNYEGAVRGTVRPPSTLTRSLAVVVSLALLAAGGLMLAPPAVAVSTTKVALTFDNNTIAQYSLAYTHALQPHNAHATFFVSSGTVGSSVNFMSWAQLATIAAAGNDIGGKSVNASNLTTDPNPTAQVCNDRAAILSHGLTPVGFAFPGGANNATVRDIVKGCGYGNARTVAGVSATGATWAETDPPVNWLATRAYAPSAVTLANMQSLVNGAASHGGGWTQIVITRVCSQALDPTNYASCSAASGHIELADLNAFLDWLGNAGQNGGAPAGATLSTLSAMANAADPGAPTTTITCNGAPCAGTPYADVVSISLTPTDVGSGVAVTRYTLDGSDPTAASPAYSGAFNVNGNSSSTTVKFRSWDYAGNAEATNTQTVQAPVDGAPPTTTIACNGVACSPTYLGSVSVSLDGSDTGGSGVATTYYTTDGSTPNTSSQVYSGPFVLANPASYTVQFFSVDKVGNTESVLSQSIEVVPVKTVVSLTFDNGTVGQYTLGYLQALQPHGAVASFFVNSGNVGVSPAIMTWAQLRTLADAGNDVGGKTVNATNLTTDPNPTAQVCNDRAALVQHGFDPSAFAYPGGSFNASLENVVRACGYGNARTAGSLSPSGPTYAETLPPTKWFATRAYAPTGQVTLTNMKSLVNGAASKGGGWSQIVIGRVCSQNLDPNNYTSCSGSAGWVELADLNSFLDWMVAAGQPAGAPAGASLATVAATAASVDSIAPSTTALCNGAPCASSTYDASVYVSLAATDSGSGPASTHYTIDGSDPSQASPTYTARIPITATTTLKFRSWDHAGNAEATQTQVIDANLPPDSTPPVTEITCNGSPCTSSAYNGSVSLTLNPTDSGGWGVDETYYTTDGTTPTTSSTVYTEPIVVTQVGNYTIQFFSVDLAGNTEPIESQAVQVVPPQTVVSFTFDDGDASQYKLAFDRGLRPRNLGGTFYINSGNLGSGPGFMTWSNLTEMAANGQEIGGHTLDHIDLASSSYTQQKKINQVCDDRQALVSHGLSVSSFAYPFGSYDANAQSIVQGCGYTSARRTGGIPLNGAPYAETIPPKDPFATITWTAPSPTTSPIQLADMQAAVTNAASHGGGWVQIVTHEMCSQTFDPADYSSCLGSFRPIELGTFNAFLDWLKSAGQPGGAPAGTIVQTVGSVINGPDLRPPVTTLLCDDAPCTSSTYHDSVTLSFAAADASGSGATTTYFTTDGSTPTTSSPTFALPFTINQPETIKFFSIDNAGNAEPVQTQSVDVQPNPDPIDSAAPTTVAACNAGSCSSGWYAATVSLALTASDTGGAGVDQTYYTTDGSTPTTGSAVYSGALTLTGTTTVRYFSTDLAGNSEPNQTLTVQIDEAAPATTIKCGAADAGCIQTYTTSVTVSLSASDTGGSGVAATYYTTDGSAPTTSSAVYAGPIDIGATTTVRFFSTDVAGNAEPGLSTTVTVDSTPRDTTAPTTTIACNSGGCTGWFRSAVTVELSASDTGGSGVNTTYYTLNGTTPTTSSAVYAGPLSVSTMTTVKFFTIDNAGNAEAVQTTVVQIDGAAPTTTISCNNGPCNGWFKTAVTVRLSATDLGSGVAMTQYTLDGSNPATSASAVTYTGPFNVSSTLTVRFASIDVAGNQESAKLQQIKADMAAPTVSIISPTTNSSFVRGSDVTIMTSVADPGTGGQAASGIATVSFLIDGKVKATDRNAPWSYVWSTKKPDVGTHIVTVVATDVAGNSTTSAPITVRIT